jgi:hypothetical protein
MLRAGSAAANQMPRAAIPAASVSSRAIRLPGRAANTPVSAVSVVAALTLAPVGSRWALPAAGAGSAAGAAEVVGAGVTTGNRLARLPAGRGADRAGTAPGGNCGGEAGGAVTPARGVGAPLAGELLSAAGPERDGDGLGEGDALGEPDLLGEGEGLGDGDLLGDGDGDLLGDGDGDLLGDGDGDLLGDGLGEGDLLGEGLGEGDLLGVGLGEGDLLGDGDELGEGELPGVGADDLGDGDGDPIAAEGSWATAGLAAAPALPRTAMRIPAAVAPPPARTCAPARARPRMRPQRWPPLGLPASLRERAAEDITAWTQPRPSRFPVHDECHVPLVHPPRVDTPRRDGNPQTVQPGRLLAPALRDRAGAESTHGNPNVVEESA